MNGLKFDFSSHHGCYLIYHVLLALLLSQLPNLRALALNFAGFREVGKPAQPHCPGCANFVRHVLQWSQLFRNLSQLHIIEIRDVDSWKHRQISGFIESLIVSPSMQNLKLDGFLPDPWANTPIKSLIINSRPSPGSLHRPILDDPRLASMLENAVALDQFSYILTEDMRIGSRRLHYPQYSNLLSIHLRHLRSNISVSWKFAPYLKDGRST